MEDEWTDYVFNDGDEPLNTTSSGKTDRVSLDNREVTVHV